MYVRRSQNEDKLSRSYKELFLFVQEELGCVVDPELSKHKIP